MNDPYEVLGVPETADDDEVKRAYRELARKYHPDNYVNNPLADLAEEKMKDINAAYEEIVRRRKEGGASARSGSYGRADSGSGGGYSGGGYTNGGYTSDGYGGDLLKRARYAIQTGDLATARLLLSRTENRGAEWHFLMGGLTYRQGMVDEARWYYEQACQLDPSNEEYRESLNYLRNVRRTAYTPTGTPFGTTICPGGDCCLPFMCCVLPYCC